MAKAKTTMQETRNNSNESELGLILIGGLEHCLFFHVLGIIIPIDYYFSEGLKPPTSNHVGAQNKYHGGHNGIIANLNLRSYLGLTETGAYHKMFMSMGEIFSEPLRPKDALHGDKQLHRYLDVLVIMSSDLTLSSKVDLNICVLYI